MLKFSLPQRRIGLVGIAAATMLAASACQAPATIEKADVAAWKAKVLPTVSGTVVEDAGKILNREPLTKNSARMPAGTYTFTMICDGGGKAFFAISAGSNKIADATAACNANPDVVKIKVPSASALTISTTSVDVPQIFAYRLVPAAG
ncbi:DUF6023 family protein [Arthrobacter sp. efr-133-TYG-104]|uniref:DUF6023 family protein n=1 Tax=Arthrobacter sp. efr-133-TYG-104 TaxID=3040324 RepID=UPI00254EC541|nr:DUF6023 family protein [Arthrobacter sp. efr-133-TYG-104]